MKLLLPPTGALARAVSWILILTLGRTVVRAEAPPEIPAAARDAALAGDWEALGRALPAPGDATLPGAARLLAAHGLLARNRVNTGATLFASADPAATRDWADWTAATLAAHPTSPWARYFRADALARTGRLADARALLDGVLGTAPTNALARNARGVVHARLGETGRALDDFFASVKHAPGLAMGWTHAAAAALQARRGARGALADASAALQASPDDALALYHRGCLLLIARRGPAAAADFQRVGEVAPELAPFLVPAADQAFAALDTPAAAGRPPAGFYLSADSPEVQRFARGDFGPGGADFKRALQSANNPHNYGLLINAALVSANGDSARRQQVGGLIRQATAEKNAAGVIAQSTRSWNVGAEGSLGRKSGPRLELKGGFENSQTRTYPGRIQADTQWREMTQQFHTQAAKSGRALPGGFDAAPGEVMPDAGDWPYVAVYALFYPEPPTSGPAPSPHP